MPGAARVRPAGKPVSANPAGTATAERSNRFRNCVVAEVTVALDWLFRMAPCEEAGPAVGVKDTPRVRAVQRRPASRPEGDTGLKQVDGQRLTAGSIIRE